MGCSRWEETLEFTILLSENIFVDDGSELDWKSEKVEVIVSIKVRSLFGGTFVGILTDRGLDGELATRQG